MSLINVNAVNSLWPAIELCLLL